MKLLGYLPLFATHEDLLFLFKIRIKNSFPIFLLLKNRPARSFSLSPIATTLHYKGTTTNNVKQ